MLNNELYLIYLLVSILFIVTVRGLAKPSTALISNRLGMAGMLIAVVATLFILPEQNHIWILIAIFAGALVGIISGIKVKITALPQMVAVFNGLGGLSSVLVALTEMRNLSSAYLEIALSVLIGAITFMGSMIAYCKLQGSAKKLLKKLPLHNFISLFSFVTLIFVFGNFLITPNIEILFYLMCFSFLWSLLVVMPVGGADMPIIVSVLNACSGFAASAIGFSVGNVALIVTGAIVGASGCILTFIMTKAINRSLLEVLFFNKTQDDVGIDIKDKTVHTASEEDVYKLTSAIFENIDAIKAENAKGAELSIENATSGMTVPFHKGAAKYFAEKGFPQRCQRRQKDR